MFAIFFVSSQKISKITKLFIDNRKVQTVKSGEEKTKIQ